MRVNRSALNRGVIMSRRREAVIAIIMKLTEKNIRHRGARPREVVVQVQRRNLRAAVIRVQNPNHRTTAVLRTARQTKNHISHMMTDTMTCIWTKIMIMTDITATVLMRTV